MSDSEIFEQNIPTEEVKEVAEPVDLNKTIKPKKKKRVLTPEQKEKLLDNLRRGREKSLETRRKNRLLKKAQKKDEEEAKDALLAKSFIKNDDLETSRLKKEMQELREQLKKQSIKEMPEPVVMEVKELKKRPPTPTLLAKPMVVTHTKEDPFLTKIIPKPKPKPVFKHGVNSFWDQFK